VVERALARDLRAKSKYVIPNAITALSIVMGMVSIYYAYQGQFVVAAWVIMYSTILDKLDGSTARVLKASSPFGGQLDSFSDFVAFGIAPAFLVFVICSVDPKIKVAFEHKDTPFFLYASLVFFILTSALRLARFNITDLRGSRYMMGMATTVAGGLAATYILTCYKYLQFPVFVEMLQGIPYLMILLGAMQVSTFPIAKAGAKKTRFARTFDAFGIVLSIVLIILRKFPEFLLGAAALYLIVSFAHAYKDRERIYAEWGLGPDALDAPSEEPTEEP